MQRQLKADVAPGGTVRAKAAVSDCRERSADESSRRRTRQLMNARKPLIGQPGPEQSKVRFGLRRHFRQEDGINLVGE